ncbi:MAG TPA: cell filamentation protein Fic, partial [Planctomycetota bacterium]|nr:cell filamentation protein Fic [Planctomycetota bacterium]
MAKPNEKLAGSLSVLKRLQSDGARVFPSKEFTRVHRERLLRGGFLQEVMKGWLISADPAARDGDSTPWYGSFWEFCARYCHDRFGNDWHLSPEQSLLLAAENTVIPAQVIVYAAKGANNTTRLAFGTSLYDLKQAQMPPRAELMELNGLRVYSPAAALFKVPGSFFVRHPIECQVALAAVRDASEVLRYLLEGGHSVVAGRLAGAFRRAGRADIADEIANAMKAANYHFRETDPFVSGRLGPIPATTAPIAGRLHAIWKATRHTVLESFPRPPRRPRSQRRYLALVDDVYKSDAYHSLSIEGYSVTPELIERVRTGRWNPERAAADRQSRDALAARGYWQAFQLVRRDVADILSGGDAAELVRKAHRARSFCAERWTKSARRSLRMCSISTGLYAPPPLTISSSIVPRGCTN